MTINTSIYILHLHTPPTPPCDVLEVIHCCALHHARVPTGLVIDVVLARRFRQSGRDCKDPRRPVIGTMDTERRPWLGLEGLGGTRTGSSIGPFRVPAVADERPQPPRSPWGGSHGSHQAFEGLYIESEPRATE